MFGSAQAISGKGAPLIVSADRMLRLGGIAIGYLFPGTNGS